MGNTQITEVDSDIGALIKHLAKLVTNQNSKIDEFTEVIEELRKLNELKLTSGESISGREKDLFILGVETAYTLLKEVKLPLIFDIVTDEDAGEQHIRISNKPFIDDNNN